MEKIIHSAPDWSVMLKQGNKPRALLQSRSIGMAVRAFIQSVIN